MPSHASKKGTGAKNTALSRDRRSLSRHSTPLSSTLEDPAPATPSTVAHSSTPTLARETAYVKTSTAAIVSSEPSIEALIDRSAGHVSSSSAASKVGGDPPSAKELHLLHDKIRDTVAKFMVRRGEVCDRSMRALVQKRKERVQIEQEQEARRVEAAASAVRAKREDDDQHREKWDKKRLGRKRSHDEMDVDVKAEREDKKPHLPSVGAHGVARQDGVGVHEGSQAPPSPVVQAGTIDLEPDLMAHSPSASDLSEVEQPAAAPLYERLFGKDPTQFDDPTIYDIREIHDDMTREEKMAILNVARWPESDLRDMTAGDPPDADFSNAKPATQINFSTFQTYVDAFIRPFTEEDVAFLKERGDRVTPYIIPARGPRGYKEVWASEDGLDGIAPPRKPEPDANEARGNMDDMNDEIAETDEVSMGPVMNRLLSLIRPTPNGARRETSSTGNNANEDGEGDIAMANGDAEASDQAQAGATEETKPTTCLPADAPRPTNLAQLDYDSLEQRALQELRYLGIINPGDATDFSAHDDDEVSARLRTLQDELRRVSRINNARRARVLELTEERMAMQEYGNIADDLDAQVNAAYSKRNRSLAKPGSKKSGSSHARPGQKGIAGALSTRGVSDGVKALMQKRRDWIDMVGPVVAYGRPPIPGDDETIFDEANMKRLEKAEREAEAGEVEGE